MRILLPLCILLCCFSATAQQGKHPRQLKGAFYFYCDYFAYVSFGIQSNGKYIFCGSTGRDDDADIFVSRYNEDGSPDEAFGKKGILRIDLAGYKDVPVFLKVLPDNKILIGAIADNAYSYRTLKGIMVLIRLNADGTTDHTFGENGKATERPDRRYKGLMAAAVSEDGSPFY